MQNKHPYKLDFEQYICNTGPAKKEKSYAWATAIGLQQVDGLTPSKYLFDTARRSINGEITIDEAKSLIDAYYESKTGRHLVKFPCYAFVSFPILENLLSMYYNL